MAMKMHKVLLFCALLAAAATAARAEEAVDWPACPEGLAGVDCGTCTEDVGAAVIAMHPNATCYTNHTYTWETTQKSYACSTEGTPVQDSITDVWGSCFTDVKKCDFGLAISGHGLTCSGLNCVFEESSVYCSYTKCSCDGTCPTANGVSLGYMLERLTGTTSMDCEDGWPAALCTLNIQGLSTSSEDGFQAYCQAGEAHKPEEWE